MSCNGAVGNDSIRDFNEKFHRNKLNIINEKNKIKQEEKLLFYFKQSLEVQNRNLNEFIEEGDRLEESISKCLGYKYSAVLNKDRIRTTMSINTDAEINTERIVLKRKNSEICDEVLKKIPLKSNVSSRGTGHKPPLEVASSKGEISFKRVELTSLKNVTIYSIYPISDLAVIFGGSNGFLMKYSDKDEHVYEAYTKENITRICSMSFYKKKYLVVLSNNKIIVYESINERIPFKVIDLPGIKDFFKDRTLLNFTLDSGLIIRININSWAKIDYNDGNYIRGILFFPCTINSKFRLFTRQDKFLYKTRKKNFGAFKPIRGITDVKCVRSIDFFNVLCQSDYKIWFLNEDFEIIKCFTFKDRINFVQSYKKNGVLVDCKDVIHVYSLSSSGRNRTFGEKIFEKKIEGKITAIHVHNETVFVAVGAAIFTYYFGQ